MTETIEKATQKAKPLRLNADARDDVRQAFRKPLLEANEKVWREAQTALAPKFRDSIYTPEEQRAIAVLKKGGWATTVSTLYVRAEGSGCSEYVKLGDATIDVVGTSRKNPSVAKSVLDEYDAAERAYDERKEEIESLTRELNTVLLVSKTRAELGQLWPPVFDLMGEAWVNAAQEPNRLPTVTTDRITAALAGITKMAA